MKGYTTENGYMGYVDGDYQLFASEADYREWMEEQGDRNMKAFFTLVGTRYYFGDEFMKPGMKVELKKEPDNEYDKEAIYVSCEGLGKVGYVGNSPHTVIGESMSSGRLYDKIGDTAIGEVVYVTSKGVLCRVCKKSLIVDKGQCKQIKK